MPPLEDVNALIFDRHARGKVGRVPLKNEPEEAPGIAYDLACQTSQYAAGSNAHATDAVCFSLRAGADGQGDDGAENEPAWARTIRGAYAKKTISTRTQLQSRTNVERKIVRLSARRWFYTSSTLARRVSLT